MARHFRTSDYAVGFCKLGSIGRRRIEAKRLRGAKLPAIIAKAASLVLQNCRRPASTRVEPGVDMRGFRLLITVLIISPILMLALSDSRLSRQPFAQVTAAPGPVPLTAPVAPGQPQAFSTIGALPSLAPAPGTVPLGVASAAATPRAFRCTCSTAGTWTEWAGVVSSDR